MPVIRHLAKWYISRAVDLAKPVPAWVRLWMQRDRDLRQFAERTENLTVRLRADAGEWSSENQTNADLVYPLASKGMSTKKVGLRTSWRKYVGQGSLATAAILIVFISLVWRPWSNEQTTTTSIHSVASTKNSASVKHDAINAKTNELRAELLAATINSSARMIQKFSMQNLRPEIERSGVADLVSSKNLTKSWPFPTTIESSTDAAASTTSKILLSLNDGMETEQLQLLDDLKQAADYFSRKLLQRALTLVGVELR
jgi:hypothetical protein